MPSPHPQLFSFPDRRDNLYKLYLPAAGQPPGQVLTSGNGCRMPGNCCMIPGSERVGQTQSELLLPLEGRTHAAVFQFELDIVIIDKLRDE